MLSPLIYYPLIGGALGAIVGYFGKCSSGTCPLTSTWWRGAIYGAVMGLLFSFVTGKTSGPIDESGKNVTRIAENQFDAEVSQSALPVVVDFYAPWCGPCKILAPRLDEQAGPLTNQIKFVKINLDEAPALARRYQIEAIPTLLFLKNGKVIETVTGLLSRQELNARLHSFAKQ